MNKVVCLLAVVIFIFLVSINPVAAQSGLNGKYVGIEGSNAVRFRLRGGNVLKFSGYFPLVCRNAENDVYSRTFYVSALDNVTFSINNDGRFDNTFAYEDVSFRSGLVQATGRVTARGGRITVYVNTSNGEESCEDAQFFRLTKIPNR